MNNQANSPGVRHRGNTRNLRPPWKKGESGNPKGRPPGIRYLSEAIRAKLPLVLPGEKEDAEKDKRKAQPTVEILADAVIQRGIEGNPAILNLLHDWTEGKVKQPVSLSGEVGLLIARDRLTAAKRRMARLKRLEDGEIDNHGETEDCEKSG